MSISVQKFTFNALQENTFVVYDETGECIIIDAGCSDKDELRELQMFIEYKKLKPVLLLNTHCHIDHVLGVEALKNYYKIPFRISATDHDTLRAVKIYSAMYGYPGFAEPEVDSYVEEGDIVSFGNSTFDVFFVPGHAPGHLAFYNKEKNILFGGDVLFYDSIGRSDLPGGNHEQLLQSIRLKLFKLDDACKVYCGHGPETTIGREKIYNPWCALER